MLGKRVVCLGSYRRPATSLSPSSRHGTGAERKAPFIVVYCQPPKALWHERHTRFRMWVSGAVAASKPPPLVSN